MALHVRDTLFTEIAVLGLVADITVASDREVESTGFWVAGAAMELDRFVAACAGPSRA